MIGHRVLALDDYLAIFRRRWWVLAICAALGASALYFGARLIPSRYTSETTVLFTDPSVPASYVQPVGTQDLSERLSAMEKQILSRSRLQTVIERLSLYEVDSQRVPMEDLVLRLRKSITVLPIEPIRANVKNTFPGFTVSVTADSPQLAQQVCSEIASMFTADNLRLRQQMSEQTTDFLSIQLDSAKAKLDEQDAKLAEFKRYNLGRLPDNERTNVNLLLTLNAQLEAANTALSRAQQDKAFNESFLAQQLASWQVSQVDRGPQPLEQQLADLQNQLITQQAQYTDNHPEVIKTKSSLAELKKQMAEANEQGRGDAAPDGIKPWVAEPPQIQTLRAQIHQADQFIGAKSSEEKQLQANIREIREHVQASPMVEQKYKELTRDYETALELYNDLLKKRDQSAMAMDLEHLQQGEQFRVLDSPSLPQTPSFPDRRRLALAGLAGGLVVGLGLSFLLEARDTTLRTQRDAEQLLQTQVLALIPTLKPLGVRASHISVYPRSKQTEPSQFHGVR